MNTSERMVVNRPIQNTHCYSPVAIVALVVDIMVPFCQKQSVIHVHPLCDRGERSLVITFCLSYAYCIPTTAVVVGEKKNSECMSR